ncbi:MAG: TetR/AcrR family transcriptional regulator [Geodermatophilaceae bacterium]|nr:TetR/AcrR family transcriptional regulator [Geodermatophilaceae bacterium]
MTARVKRTTRRYDSSGRQIQARRSREAVLDAAQRQFLAAGYAATTLAAIAKEAGVSVETIYKSFAGKSGLVRAIYERGLTGHGPVAAYQRSDEMRERETDPEVIMRNWGVLTAEVSSVVTPIRLLIRSAAGTDPEMTALLEDSDKDRLDRAHHHARFLADRGYLREGITLAKATDVVWTCSSVEFYELLVLKRGWSAAEFARFIADFMIAGLLPKPD